MEKKALRNGPTTSSVRRYRCPHCGAPAKTRSSKGESLLITRRYIQCTNYKCGHTYVALEEILYSITPSSDPNPELMLEVRNATTRARETNSGV